MMNNKEIGKTQSYSRVCNNMLVVKNLQQKEMSATELSSILSLSNATLSSILKQLSDIGIVKVSHYETKKDLGRRRVMYTLNDHFGLFLNINITNHTANISVANLKEEILAKTVLEISKYDSETIYKIILLATQLMLKDNIRILPLKCIVISLPGRINQEDGKLMLSKQFDEDLFKEDDFIKNAFKNQFPNVPILIKNDVNVAALGEMRKGSLINVKNAIYISIDTGIGGSLIIDHKLFGGDYGFCGEFGLIKVEDEDGRAEYLDELVSLRVLCKYASDKYNKRVGRTDLVNLFHSDEEIHQLVLKSARIIGKAIKNIVEVLDINTIVLGGRVVYFGEGYLNCVKSSIEGMVSDVSVSYSTIHLENKIIGSAGLGVEYLIEREINKGENL